jgi:hypothetical protein
MITLVAMDDDDKKQVLADHLEANPQDRNKLVDWITLEFVDPPPRETYRPDVEPEPEPERAPACVPDIEFWATVAHGTEENPAGEIREGLYGVADGQVFVANRAGKFLGRGRAGNDPLASARAILVGATKGAAKWLRAALPSKSIV